MTVPAASPVQPAVGIAEGAGLLALALPPDGDRRLADYVALLGKWNRVYNLTAIREPERIVTHHVLDSLAVLPALSVLGLDADACNVLDVGSGGGLPGIPIAVARPQWRVVMCEPSHKKASFIAQAVAELGLRNAEVAATRVEDYRPAEPFGIVISRAFSDLATFVRMAGRHVGPGGAIVAMKGVVPDEEIADLPADFAVVAIPSLEVPGLDASRHLLVMKRKDQR